MENGIIITYKYWQINRKKYYQKIKYLILGNIAKIRLIKKTLRTNRSQKKESK